MLGGGSVNDKEDGSMGYKEGIKRVDLWVIHNVLSLGCLKMRGKRQEIKTDCEIILTADVSGTGGLEEQKALHRNDEEPCV